MMMAYTFQRLQQFVALLLIFLLTVGSASAGLTVTGADGLTVTGADGVNYVRTSGLTVTGADNLLAFGVNGITPFGADGLTVTGADGLTVTGADGVTYSSPNRVVATRPDGLTVTGADGLTVTGADGLTVTGADGNRYRADSVTFRRGNGLTVTGADGLTVTGADGIAQAGSDGLTVTGADGLTVTGADGLTVTGADGLTVTGADGQIFSASPNGLTVTGADTISMTKVTGLTVTGADSVGLPVSNDFSGPRNDAGRGLQSVDPELALILSDPTDDSNIAAVIVYHQSPSESDIADLQRIGVLGGTRYNILPMIAITAKRTEIIEISHLSNVRSIYGNRTLESTADTRTALTGVDRVRRDSDLTRKNLGVPVGGRGTTVAVLDTGLDGTHADLSGRVVQNVKLADTQSISVGFTSPVYVEGLQNTDQVYGHGTFVAGLIAGNGMQSGGKYGGVAPSARLLGLSAGDLTLSFVLSGFDYLLGSGSRYNARVVNCSFSADTVFDYNDPVNVATRMLTDRGINVVFSAGNTGDGLHSLNPYAVAPWVVSVGATDSLGRLSDFSSRGDFGSALFHPTLVAPGDNVVSLRSTVSATGLTGLAGADTAQLTPAEIPYYTTARGTSFSAPQVAGAIALMLEANPQLTPAEVRDILQRSATPLPNYYQHEVGAGMLNAHAAVLEAAFAGRRMGMWRATLDRGQAQFITDPLQQFNGTVTPGAQQPESALSIPENAVLASVEVAWGPMTSANDLGLTVTDATGTRREDSDDSSGEGLTSKRERVGIKMPSAGVWRARVGNLTGMAGTPQPFLGLMQVTRVEYAPLQDVSGLSPAQRAEIYQALRTFVMSPYGEYFRPGYGVSRADLAAALVKGAGVPQYLPAKYSYTDVTDATTSIFVESAQAAPGGALFINTTAGGAFRPQDSVDRLTAAVALVRAAGLRSEAEAKNSQPLVYVDAMSIPSNLRGYVRVAIDRGLLAVDGGQIRPGSALTRAELAHALVAIQKLAAG
ncbi:MAG TPA: S8 family serine peptidase [Pyrinomonadaceae bacterium]|jgi:serine protease AprX|nr:S8 family serine peptidase [Pyrinomonadaceae bacterium]